MELESGSKLDLRLRASPSFSMSPLKEELDCHFRFLYGGGGFMIVLSSGVDAVVVANFVKGSVLASI